MRRLSLSLVLSLLTAACSGTRPTGGGDGGAGGPDADLGPTPTFHEDVSPIMMAKCVRCHSDDEATRIAPFSLTTYDSAQAIGATGQLDFAVANRIMPPWSANGDGTCQTYQDSLWLSDAEIATITRWVAGGMPEGDPATAPPVPEPPAGLSGATTELAMQMAYVAPSQVTDEYRCFVLDPNLASDKFITAEEMIMSDPAVSHHAILYSLASQADASAVRALDAADPQQGYECFGGPGATAGFAAGWVPGFGPTYYPAGTGVRLKAGLPVVLQMHFNYTSTLAPSQTTVRLKLADSVSKEAFLIPIADHALDLPMGQASVIASATTRIPGSGALKVWGILPHMHKLGHNLKVAETSGTCLTDVQNWSFQWQRMYWYSSPLTVHGGDQLSITCDYDTRTAAANVSWGERTSDEMCLAFLYATP